MHPFSPNTAAIDWCEANYTASTHVAELSNTLSSLLFVPAGLLVLWLSRRAVYAATMRQAGAVIVAIGLGSAWFHATLSQAGQFIDEASIVWLLVVGLGHLSGWSLQRVVVVSVAASAVMLLAPALNPVVLFGAGCVLLLRACRCQSMAPRSLSLCVGLMFLGLCTWGLDRLCFQELLSLHAIWHAFAAAGAVAAAFWLGHTPPVVVPAPVLSRAA